MADYTSYHHRRRLNPSSKSTATLQTPPPFAEEEEEEEADEIEGGDPAVLVALTDNFRRVQSVLDRNRFLIQQVNENHQSKIHENMVENVSLIQEINANITEVLSLYSDLSANFPVEGKKK